MPSVRASTEQTSLIQTEHLRDDTVPSWNIFFFFSLSSQRGRGVGAMAHAGTMWEDNIAELVLSFHLYVGVRDLTHVAWLLRQMVFPLGNLVSHMSPSLIFFIWEKQSNFIYLFIFKCIFTFWISCARVVCVCIHVTAGAQGLQEDGGSPGAGATGSWEPPDISAKKGTLDLCKGSKHF